LRQPLRNVAYIAEELAKQLFIELWHRLTIIPIAGGDAKLQDFAPIIDHQVQFEVKESAGGGFTTRCQAGKYLVDVNALVETHIHRSRVDERETTPLAQATGLQIHEQRDQGRGVVLDKASITYQSKKLGPPGFQDLLTIVGFEISVMGLVKGNQERLNSPLRASWGFNS
jgi:hypothetical protein